MRLPSFENNQIYHIYNRGVDKRNIFVSDNDRSRFIESMYLFNNIDYRRGKGDKYLRMTDLASHEVDIYFRKPFVDIYAYCLMGNHFHLLLKQKEDGGVSRFMHRLGMGYSQYFNRKYSRSGALFEGKFKSVHVSNDSHLYHLPRYIHLNAIDVHCPMWRTEGVGDVDEVMSLLDRHIWSSHVIYMTKKQEYPIINFELFDKFFTAEKSYLNYISEWSSEFMVGHSVADVVDQ